MFLLIIGLHIKKLEHTTFTMDRLYHVLGENLVDTWIDMGSMGHDNNMWSKNLDSYDTREKRRTIVRSEHTSNNCKQKFGTKLMMFHPNYTLAFIEYDADLVEDRMATRIQKRVRGWLARNELWSPYTELGQRRLNKMFSEL